MKGWFEYTLSLVVRAPVLTQGLEGARVGLDASFLRDECGRPVLSGDQVKGLLRAAYGDGAGASAIFGPAHSGEDETGNREPVRSGINISDCSLRQIGAPVADPADAVTKPVWGDWMDGAGSSRVRVAIDAESGRALDGHLQFAENIARSGTLLRFEGRIFLRDALKNEIKNLGDALQRIPAFGAFRSVGWGEHLTGLSEIAGPVAASGATYPQSGEVFQVEVSFDRPLLVGAGLGAGNVFTGSTIIPGTVIKGALAAALHADGAVSEALDAALSACRISHARPLSANGEPLERALPLSLVKGYKGSEPVFADMALAPGKAALIAGKASDYLLDWKSDDFGKAIAKLGRPTDDGPRHLQRTRVKIGTEGVAEDKNLFVFEPVASLRDDGSPWVWRFRLDLRDTDPESRKKLLSTLADGLAGVGKTDAVMQVRSIRSAELAAAPIPSLSEADTDLWAITLETSAMMLDPDDDPDAQVQYAAYWVFALETLGLLETDASQVKLVNLFATDYLAGGYVALRYQPYGAENYRPFWMTSPGSVFVLSAPKELRSQIATALQTALHQGLPVRWPVKAELGKKQDWQVCPFIPQHGFGEISLLGKVHEELRLGADGVGGELV